MRNGFRNEKCPKHLRKARERESLREEGLWELSREAPPPQSPAPTESSGVDLGIPSAICLLFRFGVLDLRSTYHAGRCQFPLPTARRTFRVRTGDSKLCTGPRKTGRGCRTRSGFCTVAGPPARQWWWAPTFATSRPFLPPAHCSFLESLLSRVSASQLHMPC